MLRLYFDKCFKFTNYFNSIITLHLLKKYKRKLVQLREIQNRKIQVSLKKELKILFSTNIIAYEFRNYSK